MKNINFTLILLATFLTGCGGADGDSASQPGSTIQIAPSARTHTYSGSVIQYDASSPPQIVTFIEDFVTITVLGPNNAPQRNADVRFYHLGPGTMADINKVLQNEPYITQTDDFGNVYMHIYTPTYDKVGSTSTDFEAISGSAYQKMTVTMTCTDSNTGTPACD